MLAVEQKQSYDMNDKVQKCATGLHLQVVVRKLDLVYGFVPFSSRHEAWNFILNHPKIIGYGLDKRYVSER